VIEIVWHTLKIMWAQSFTVPFTDSLRYFVVS
jgi:hypothetical protein